MGDRPRPPSRHPLRAVLLGGLLAVATACGVDGGVVSLSATPTPSASGGSTSSTPPPDDTTPDDSTPDDTDPVATTPPTTPPDSTLPAIVEPELRVSIPLADVVDFDAAKPERDHDAFVAVAFTDIERWVADVFPAVYGTEFTGLSGALYAGYPERETDIPGCGEPTTSYADLQLFVAFYCEFGDFMAYDDGAAAGSLLTPLADEYGPAVMGIVLAHEYGHVIQQRIGALDDLLATVVTEQQADCFAGAWFGQAYRGESELLRLGDRDVRAGLLAMLYVRDPVGTDQFVPGGHGSAFDRVGAFQEGFTRGPGRCAELLDAPLRLMPNQFQPNSADQLLGGNAPYDCSELDPDEFGQEFVDACSPAPEFLAEDLDHFWATALGDEFAPVTARPADDLGSVTCSDPVRLTPELIVCPDAREVVYDEPAVLDLYREFGDFTLGYLYGIGWAELVQRDLGSPLAGEQRALLDDCLTGAWVHDITPDQAGNTPRQGDRDGDEISDTVTSSPGDLDEAIRMAILVGDEGADVDRIGSPFEKIDAFRAGVLGGLAACENLF